MRRRPFFISLLLLICTTALAQPALSQPRRPTPALEQERLYLVTRTESRYRNSFGFIDRTGKFVIGFEKLPKTTRYVGEFHEGRAVIHLQKRQDEDAIKGYIDRTGTIVIAARFEYARDFSEGLAYVETKQFHGFIDPQGNTVINLDRLKTAFVASIEDLGAKDFHEGRAAVGTGRFPGYRNSFGDANQWAARWGYINRAGNLVVEPLYVFAEDFSEGLAGVVTNEGSDRREAKHGFIDADGRMVVRAQFSPRRGGPHLFGIGGTASFHEGLACVKTPDGFYGYIDRKGAFVIPAKLANAKDFSDGLAWAVGLDFEKNVFTNVGFLDKSGRWVLTEYKGEKFAHNAPLRFSEGLAAVPSSDPHGGGWAYMNHEGLEVIKTMYLSTADPIEDGIARVSLYDPPKADMYGYVDKQGQFIWRSK